MILTLRQAIIERVHDKSNDELSDIISSSIDGEEQALPGLGVLFEIIWKNSGADVKNQLVSTLKEHLA
ncbi:small acid-soluble spore protein SspI [Paenibacillus filicis]|uniref:Small, acid-soluble spore protein I n=1 Tax=Paenibacillus gyeongsangnamensis TaxID=3388067 RepID=A0ABT4Q9V3_9BACL|nr:small acid-soluble spore protein SspI [Paenibacillus filicis]MCZ8513664.1 small acid-soluble spore protein SspI [Paenibacillus filicis]